MNMPKIEDLMYDKSGRPTQFARDLAWINNKFAKDPVLRSMKRQIYDEAPKPYDPGIYHKPNFTYLGQRLPLTAVMGWERARCNRRVLLLDVRYNGELLAQRVTTTRPHYFEHLGPWPPGIRIAFIAKIARFTPKGASESVLKIQSPSAIRVVL